MTVENVIQIKSGCRCECKKHNICEKDYIWNPATCSSKNDKYLGSIIDNSVIACDRIIDVDEQTKSYDEGKKQLQQILMKKMQSI